MEEPINNELKEEKNEIHENESKSVTDLASQAMLGNAGYIKSSKGDFRIKFLYLTLQSNLCFLRGHVRINIIIINIITFIPQ